MKFNPGPSGFQIKKELATLSSCQLLTIMSILFLSELFYDARALTRSALSALS
jgi:hypothetical protein